MKSTGNRIQTRREALGLSREQLAKKLGITRMTVWRIETGTSPLTTDELRIWARALKVKAAELL